MAKAKLPFVPDPALDEIFAREWAEHKALIESLDQVCAEWTAEWEKTHPQTTEPPICLEDCITAPTPQTPQQVFDDQAITEAFLAEWNATHPSEPFDEICLEDCVTAPTSIEQELYEVLAAWSAEWDAEHPKPKRGRPLTRTRTADPPRPRGRPRKLSNV